MSNQTQTGGLAGHKLTQRGLRPVADLASNREHGERLRYMAGCRCSECRRANTDYERARAIARAAGDWNGIVSAQRAKEHMAQLSAHNVGRRAVADATGVAETTLSEINAGRKTHIRARTERLILAVTQAAAADRALIAAGPTWKLLKRLLREGYTSAELARHMGYSNKALQFGRDFVTVRNAFEVERLHQQLRTCPARPTLKLIRELREEGFRLAVIAARVAEMGGLKEAPALTARQGRIRADIAELVKRVYAQLTQ